MPRADAGFTLLEALVAVVIATSALLILSATASSSLALVDRGGRLGQAVSRARSHLVGAAHAHLVSGTQNGDDGGGYHWRTAVALAATASVRWPSFDTLATSPALSLYTITSTVSWRERGREQSVSLATQVLAPAPAQAP
jgi:type II secretory pathway pseudopilin PulG